MTRRFPAFGLISTTLWASPPALAAPSVRPARGALERPAADFIPRPTVPIPPPTDPLDTCALLPAEAPDFRLEDVNPTSPTWGDMVDRTEPGHVTLLYIALASCGHCQADTDALGAMVDEQGVAWDEVSVRILALNTAHDSLPELAEGHNLPILVDTDELNLERQYGAERWYIYLLDRSGMPAMLHYEIDFVSERDRLIDEVNLLLAGESIP